MLQINTLARLDLGVKDENKARDLYIDMNAWYTEYPNGSVSILHKRNGDQTKYAVGGTSFDRETGILTWTPTAYDTFYVGKGLAEIRITENDVVKKTKDVVTEVARSLMLGSGETLESGWQNLVNTIESLKNAAEQAAEEAVHNPTKDAEAWAVGTRDGVPVESTDPTYHNNSLYWKEQAAESATSAGNSATSAGNSATSAGNAKTAAEAARDAAQAAMAHYPYVDTVSGNWMVWDTDTGAFVNTGIHAQGPTGAVPNLTVGTVTTLQPGESATVERRSGSPDTAPVFDFGIPKGDTGSMDNAYGTTIPMSDVDSTKIATAIGNKADKVSSAETGNFAGLDANGNLTDSGRKASDFLTSHQDITGKADKVRSAVTGNFAGLDANGNLTDSGKSAIDFEITQAGIAIVNSGDTAQQAISSGQYVFIKNHSTLATGLYHATAAIANGASISSSNVAADADGVANALNDQIGSKWTITFEYGSTDLSAYTTNANPFTCPYDGYAEIKQAGGYIVFVDNASPTPNQFTAIKCPADSQICVFVKKGTKIRTQSVSTGNAYYLPIKRYT